ncbi:MAG: acyl--CoA ligase [Parvularculaceae bacterium]|nr:acyl--CoA ligase [Parvularculaceae bacterium]
MSSAPSTEQIAASAMKLLMENPLFKVGSAAIRGNEYRVFENAPPHLGALFAYGASHGDKEFLFYDTERWTYTEIWSQACRFANALSEKFSVKKGDRVAIAMRNYPEWITAYMAIISLGAVAAPLNAWWKTDELEYSLRDCGAKLVILDRRRLDYLAPVKAQLGLTFILARDDDKRADFLYRDVVAQSPSDAPPLADIAPDDDFAIYYTSGSTGNPKGVILTHRGAVTTLMSWAFLASAVKDARGGVSLFGDDPGILLAVPLFHVTGSHSIFMLSWMVGRRLAIMYRWDAKLAVDLINRHKLTNFVGVPSQSYELIEAAGDTGVPSLIDIGSGGAKRPPDQVKKLKDKFRNANPSSGYGLSETNALGCVISLDDYQKRPDSTGRAVPPCCDIKIVGDNGDAKTGEVGEVWIRSAANFRGYLNLPEETAKALTEDGWFRTGDLGRFDEEGFLYIVDRIKDLIIRSGENISCLEVEAHAYEHAAVDQAVAFSVPDEVLGERVGLVVYPKAGADFDPLELRDFMAAKLANFKCPERIWVSPTPLPRLGTEKFDKRTVRMIALQHPPAWRV